RNVLAVHQLNQDGNVARLDDIENVFAQEVDDARCQAETGNAAPDGGRCLKISIAKCAHTPANPGTDPGDQDIGNRDAEIDEHTECNEGPGAHHQAERTAN